MGGLTVLYLDYGVESLTGDYDWCMLNRLAVQVLDDVVAVDLEIGAEVSDVEGALGTVGAVVLVESVCVLPFVRNTVAIGIERRGRSVEFGPSAHVVLRVDNLAFHVAHHLVDDARIDGIARFAGAGIGEDAGKGISGGLPVVEFDSHREVCGLEDGGLLRIIVGFNAFVIVRRHIGSPVHNVAVDIELAREDGTSISTIATRAGRVENLGSAIALGIGSRPIVVILDIDRTVGICRLASVGTIVAPVEDDVVDKIDGSTAGGVNVVVVEARVAAIVVGEEVVMEGGIGTTPNAAVAVIALRVGRALEGLGDDAPLHGEVGVAIEGSALVNAPTHGAMVDHDIVVALTLESVVSVGGYPIAQTEAEELDNDILQATEHERIVRQGDAITGSGLSGDGKVAVGRFEYSLEMDGT